MMLMSFSYIESFQLHSRDGPVGFAKPLTSNYCFRSTYAVVFAVNSAYN